MLKSRKVNPELRGLQITPKGHAFMQLIRGGKSAKEAEEITDRCFTEDGMEQIEEMEAAA